MIGNRKCINHCNIADSSIIGLQQVWVYIYYTSVYVFFFFYFYGMFFFCYSSLFYCFFFALLNNFFQIYKFFEIAQIYVNCINWQKLFKILKLKTSFSKNTYCIAIVYQFKKIYFLVVISIILCCFFFN